MPSKKLSGDDDEEGWDDLTYLKSGADKEESPETADTKTIDSSDKKNKSKKQNPIKRRLMEMDFIFDNWMSKYSHTADESIEMMEQQRPIAKEKVHEVLVTAQMRRDAVEDMGDEAFQRIRSAKLSDVFVTSVLKHSKAVIAAVLIITIIISALGIPNIRPNIRGDLDVYLPTNNKVSNDLNSVRQDWSTDLVVVYCETPNAKEKTDKTNITNVAALREMSRLEEEINPDKGDKGEKDGVVFVLSLSILIKEINSTPQRIRGAIEDELPVEYDFPGNFNGNYSIPDQGRVDQIVSQIPAETLNAIVKDTNGDGVLDTAAIMIGLSKDSDQDKFISDLNKKVKMNDPYQNSHWERDYNNGKIHIAMTVTGPATMIHSITDRTYKETMRVIPLAIIFLILVLLIFHRNWKILPIIWIPVLSSLGLTFGIIGMLNITLSPQVVFVAPVLLALGLAYGLYIANAYSENEDIKDREERVMKAVHDTSRPILLSAVTTAFGFGALMSAAMIPMQVLGFSLALGMMICYGVTMLTVPSLVLWLNYKENASSASWKSVGYISVRNRKKILATVVIFIAISLTLVPTLQANMDYIAMSPQDDPAIIKMAEFSDKFGSGMIGMIAVEGRPGYMDNPDPEGSMRDYGVLKDISYMEDDINQVKMTQCLSIVDIMKTMSINVTLTNPLNNQPIYLNGSFWTLMERMSDDKLPLTQKSTRQITIDIFYNSISPEMRGMLMTSDYSRTLIYVIQPSVPTDTMRGMVDDINNILDNGIYYTRGESASGFTGTGAILVEVNDLLLINSFQSLFVSMILVFIVLFIAFNRSWRFALTTMIPIIVVVALEPLTLKIVPRFDPLQFTFMGFGIYLNLFTAIIASVITGLGVDFSIHITERVRKENVTIASVVKAVNTSGHSFTEATVTMIVGLATTFIIPISSMWEFVELIVIMLVFSVLGALFILPSFYVFIIKDIEKSSLYKRDLTKGESKLWQRIKKSMRS